MILAVACVLVPFLGWQQTWFGRRLSDREMERYLGESGRPRQIQHALSQISDRIIRGDPAVKRWYPRIEALSRHPMAPIRTMAAWVMGQDNRSDAFHQALRPLLNDSDVLVRRNAALALVRFGDAAGRPELVRILATGDAGQVWEALRALYLVGQPQDLPEVERSENSNAPERVRLQAALTARAIRTRSERIPTR